MRSFIILGFLAAVASAGTLSGYHYGPGLSGVRQEILTGSNGLSGSGSLIGQGSSYNNVVGSGLQGSYVSGSSNGGLINSGSQIISSGSSLGYGSSLGSGLVSNGGYVSSGSGLINNSGYKQVNIGIDALDSVPQTVEYSKQFYHFTAPEEAQVEGQITKQLSNVLKKNLQVVFIKAPENNAATNAALQLAKQAIEQKTAIYVLSKQNDGSQLIGQLQQIQENVQTAPEVKFVKYRTAQDVQRAKAEIQSQYNNFGGASESFDGGVAPVLNYASAAYPSQIVIGGASQLVRGGSSYGSGSKFGSSQLVGSGSSYGSGSSLGSSQLIGSGSSFGSSGSSLGSSQLIGSGSSFGSSGSSLGSSQLIGSGSGSSLGSSQLIASGSGFGSGSSLGSSQLIGSGSSYGSGSSLGSSQIIGNSGSSYGSSGSESVQLVGLGSSNEGSTTSKSYLAPLPFKK